MSRFVIAIFLLLSGWSTPAQSQNVDCQAILSRLLSGMGGPGNYSGGAEDLANIYNTYCQGGQSSPQPQQSSCPAGNEECGNYCCGSGNYCSRYGCIARGSIECGGWHCDPGQQCSRLQGRCLPAGKIDCGAYYCDQGQVCGRAHRACLASSDIDCGGHHCSAGQKCASGNKCIPEKAADCGAGKGYCNDGKCSRDGNRCLAQDAVDCGAFSCKAGSKCGSGNQCLASADIDCGGGKSCPAGNLCFKGGAECLTQEQITKRNQDEKRQKDDDTKRAKEAREAQEFIKKEKIRIAKEENEKREENARQLAKQKQEQEKLQKADEERRRKEAKEAEERVKQETKRLAKEAEARKQEEKKRQEREAQEATVRAKTEADAKIAAEVERKKKQEAESVEKLRSIANDMTQTPAARTMATIALGNTAKPNEASNREANKFEVTPRERDLAIHVARQSTKSTNKSSTDSSDQDLRATMNDRLQPLVVRKIAAIGLGLDPDKLDASKSSGGSKTALTPAQLDFLRKNIVELSPSSAATNNSDPRSVQSPANQPHVQSTFPGPVEIGSKKQANSPSTIPPSDVKQGDPFNPTQREKDLADAKRKADEEKARQQAAREKPTTDVETSEVCGSTFGSLGSCAAGGLIPDGKWCHQCTREKKCKLVYGFRHCSDWSEKLCGGDICRSRSYRPMSTKRVTMPEVAF
jgi:hypothetical protein